MYQSMYKNQVNLTGGESGITHFTLGEILVFLLSIRSEALYRSGFPVVVIIAVIQKCQSFFY